MRDKNKEKWLQIEVVWESLGFNWTLVPSPLFNYHWNFGECTTATTTTATHTYATPGVYPLTLTVSNGQATSTDTAVITVATSTTLAADFKVSKLIEVHGDGTGPCDEV